MSKFNLNKYSEADLKSILEKSNTKNEYFDFFILKYNFRLSEVKRDYKDFREDEIDDGDTLSDIALRITHGYVDEYIKHVKKGHSPLWAETYADYMDEHEETAFYNSYERVKDDSPEQAEKELLVECKALNADEYFIKHFLFLFSSGNGLDYPQEKAGIYSKAFNHQIKLGKSEIFATTYADNLADQYYSELYCYAYADAYDRALIQGKTESYAVKYGKKFGNLIAKKFGRMIPLNKDPDFDFAHDNVIAYMKAWEYAVENNLENASSFISLYQNKYMNTYYAVAGRPRISEEELDSQILDKVLKAYHRIPK